MNRLLVKILGSLIKVSIVELLSFTTISAYDREFSAVISFKSIDDEKELFKIEFGTEEINKFGEIAREAGISVKDKTDGGNRK